ncbi:uncharacterized protein LOC122459444 [Dermochelys coriacea]|uniref:uncharacterized protein LOC122459444 n=1 Tax=Dermochelys coriacea TaxID=27794 RepID=UPI001CAA1B6A|nr:uncharacterized protein LOC122459444 [Dermochelys coriacea]
MTPVLEPELKTHLLRAALHAIFTLVRPGYVFRGLTSASQRPLFPSCGRCSPSFPNSDPWLSLALQDLHRVLPDLLDASLGNLLAESPDTDRLHDILENSAEFPRMGHHVAQLALSISDPVKDISWQAREGVYWLYQLLLHQRGLTIHEAEDLWCWDWHQDSRVLGFRNRQIFGKFFSKEQRRSFLWMAVLAIHDPLLRVSQATPSWGKLSS